MELKNVVRTLAVTAGLCGCVVFTAGMPVSCKMSEEGLEIVGEELESPKIVSFYTQDSSNLVLVCSRKVSVEQSQIQSEDGLYLEKNAAHEYSADGTQINFKLNEPASAGKNYTLQGTVKDEGGNELSFSLPFAGYNDNPARLLLSEVRTKHQTSSGLLKKAEFVEFYVLKGGSTAGLEVVTGSDGEEKKYSFPDIEVKTGEYVVLHYRTVADGNCTDETGTDLTLSTATDSSASRDLWIENTDTVISDNDVILVRDICRNSLQDAVLFCASDKTDWYLSLQKSFALQAFEDGIWSEGAAVENAADSKKVTYTRTLSRLNVQKIAEAYPAETITDATVIKAGKSDWAVVKKGTPGAENCTEVVESEK